MSWAGVLVVLMVVMWLGLTLVTSKGLTPLVHVKVEELATMWLVYQSVKALGGMSEMRQAETRRMITQVCRHPV
jgi:hypothetical protein